MFECMLFGRAEEPHGHERPPPRSRNPAGNFQIELGNQCRSRTPPIRLVCQIHVDSHRDVFLHLILEKLLPVGRIFVPLFDSPPERFQPGKRDCQLSVQRSSLRQFQVGFPLDSRIGTRRQRRGHPASALFVESQSHYSGFGPREQSKRSKRRCRIAVRVLPVQLHQHYVTVQCERVHYLRLEEILAARRNVHGVRLESCCSRQRQKQPVDLAAISVTPLPQILYVIYFFLLFALLLLLGLLRLPGSISQLLHFRVDLPQFHFRHVARRDDFRHSLLHRFALSGKTFHPVVQLLPCFLSEFVGLFCLNTVSSTEV